MARRLRSCAECPRCGTRYLIGFSPYGNGAYLESFVTRFSKEYLLFCPCLDTLTSPRCSPSDLKRYAISLSAYDRGYGDPSEIGLHVAMKKKVIAEETRNETERTGDAGGVPYSRSWPRGKMSPRQKIRKMPAQARNMGSLISGQEGCV